MCKMVVEFKENLKKIGKGIRVIEKGNDKVKVSDIFLNEEGTLLVEQYEGIELEDLKIAVDEDELIDIFNNAVLRHYDEKDNQKTIQAILLSVSNSFDTSKLVNMDMYKTEQEFALSNFPELAYLSNLN